MKTTPDRLPKSCQMLIRPFRSPRVKLQECVTRERDLKANYECGRLQTRCGESAISGPGRKSAEPGSRQSSCSPFTLDRRTRRCFSQFGSLEKTPCNPLTKVTTSDIENASVDQPSSILQKISDLKPAARADQLWARKSTVA